MDIEPLRVALAIGPRYDVRGPQEVRVADPRDGALAVPIAQQGAPEDVLTEARDGEALRLGVAGQAAEAFSNSASGASGRLAPSRHARSIPL